ncbi:MAG: zinc ribbon domain-containing protein [Cyanobacteria bacterium P01_F01_bin.53]
MVTAAAYKYDISAHQTLYIGVQGNITTVTVQNSSPGQQQQASHQFSTGQWTSEPLLYALGHCIIVVIGTSEHTYTLQVQGGQTQMSTGPRSQELETLISQTQPSPLERMNAMPSASMPSMKPMKPMEPMQMNMNPMSMRLGNMAMSMGTAASSSTSTSQSGSSQPSSTSQSNGPSPAAAHDEPKAGQSDPSQKVKRFCPQCGSGTQPSDRFCAYCGHAL